MVAWVVISRQHLPRASRGPRQAYKSGPIRALPLPSSLFSPSPPVMSHQSLVTRFTVVHPLSIQPLTKCSSRNSFVFKTIHFDGGVYPALYPAAPLNFPTFKPANLPTSHRPIPFLFTLLRTLLHLRKTQLLCFQMFPHSLPKTTRGGGCCLPRAFRLPRLPRTCR